MPLLEISNLSVTFGKSDAPFKAVDGVSLTVNAGEVVSIVGESGSGKSVTSLALMGLVAFPGHVSADCLMFDGQDMLSLSPRKRRAITGKDIAMIFQEPMTSLNPCFTIGTQISETLKVHEGGSRKERWERAADLLSKVGIPDPKKRLTSYPHQLSGGMSQRVMIAMAIACRPRLLIADEPTTALDVTIQAQIMDLLLELQCEQNMALILITHDLAIVAEASQRVIVLYAGQVVETGTVPTIFETPRHPYTAALLGALPERSTEQRRLSTIPGVVPGTDDRPKGCLLHPRCRHTTERCRTIPPALSSITLPSSGLVRCHTPLDNQGNPMP